MRDPRTGVSLLKCIAHKLQTMKFANRIRLVHRANKTRVTVGVVAGIQVLTSDLTDTVVERAEGFAR